jgi:hypothetical protein
MALCVKVDSKEIRYGGWIESKCIWIRPNRKLCDHNNNASVPKEPIRF